MEDVVVRRGRDPQQRALDGSSELLIACAEALRSHTERRDGRGGVWHDGQRRLVTGGVALHVCGKHAHSNSVRGARLQQARRDGHLSHETAESRDVVPGRLERRDCRTNCRV